jgi:hypothetical protein
LAYAHDEVHKPKGVPVETIRDYGFHLDVLAVGENALEELECRIMSEAFLRGDKFVFV